MSRSAAGKARSILVVEDEEFARNRCAEALAGAGYDVECVAGGYEAIRRLATREFGLILTDIHMPEGDGLELTLHAKKHHPTVGIVVMSSPTDGPYLETAICFGARAYLEKPVSAQVLVDTIDRAFQRS